MSKDIGIYVHIPFCKQKCFYCDFVSYPNKEELVDEYIKYLNCEIKQVSDCIKIDYKEGRGELVNVKTIYIGGGTPSYIDSKYIVQILENIKTNFDVKTKNIEITIELNPGTVNKEKLEDYLKAGINRLSIGLQTTNDTLLKKIGRIHNLDDFLNTYKLAESLGFKNINADLMLGVPTQTIDDIKQSLNTLIKLKVPHISVYSFILEEGTVIAKNIEEGIMKLPEDIEERQMYWYVKERLEEAGYNHYEISNFSKKGFESQHNLDCWSQKEYIGFGVAAHSYTNNVRYSNIENLEEYINNYKTENEQNNFVFHEKQDEISKMKEYVILHLRKLDGINQEDFLNKFKKDIYAVFKIEINNMIKKGLITKTNNNIKLTKKGLDLANIVWEEFI